MKLLNKVRNFGLIPIGVASFSRIMRKLKLPKYLINSYVNWKNRYLSRWLWKHFSDVVIEKPLEEPTIDEGYVFVFWWQGEQLAPPIVKACIASVRRWCTDREVVVLDKYNYKNFATLPICLVNKFSDGLGGGG